jgi:mycothiol synthase
MLNEITLPTRWKEYILRPGSVADSPAVHEIYVASDLFDWMNWAGSLQEVKQDFENPLVNPEKDTVLVLTSDGRPAAFGILFPNEEGSSDHLAFLYASVHPEHRRRGLGSLLMTWLEQSGREWLAGFQDTLPRRLRVNCPERNKDRVKLFEKHGFLPVRFFFRMRRDLRDPIPDRPFPEGIVVRPFSPEYSEAAREVVDLAFQDHWHHTPITPVIWSQMIEKSDSFRPDLSQLAFAGDRIVGISINRVFAEDNARAGIQEGWIGNLGVLKEWRGRGLASAMLCDAMRRFTGDGLTSAGLNVDTENYTGAVAIYERLGFTTIEKLMSWFKEV